MISKKEKEKEQKEVRNNLLSCVLFHHQMFGDSIDQAIFLIPSKKNTTRIFERLTKLFKQQKKIDHSSKKNQIQFPNIANIGTVSKNIFIIDPTQRLFKTESKNNFITPFYLMSSVKKAKFVFVFNESQVNQIPRDEIKNSFLNFMSMFKDLQSDQHLLSNLCRSCSILVYGCDKKDSTFKNITNRILTEGILEKQYIQNRKNEIWEIAETIKANNRILVWKTGNQSAESLLQHLENTQVQYCNLKGKVEFGLTTNYSQFWNNKAKLNNCWKEIFVTIVNKTDLLVMGKNDVEGQILNKIQIEFGCNRQCFPRKIVQIPATPRGSPTKSIKNQMKMFSKSQQKKYQTDYIVKKLQFISDYINMNFNLSQFHQQAMESYLKILYDYDFLLSQNIRIFMRCHYIFYRKINKFSMVDDERNLVQETHFKDKITFDVVNTVCKNLVIDAILQIQDIIHKFEEKEIWSIDFKKLIECLNQLLQQKDKDILFFLSNRIVKKLEKLISTLSFYKIKLSKKKQHEKIQESLSFLIDYGEVSSCLDSFKSYFLENIADYLVKIKQYKKALQIYSQLGEVLFSKKILKVYENYLKIYPKYLQFASKKELDFIFDNYFSPYCTYLVKIGQKEKVRQLCILSLSIVREERHQHLIKQKLVESSDEVANQIYKQSIFQIINENLNSIDINIDSLIDVQRVIYERKNSENEDSD